MTTPTLNFSFLKPDVASAAEKDRWGTLQNNVTDAIDSQLKTRTQSYDFDGYELIDAKSKGHRETRYNFTSDISGNAVTIDYNNGNYQYATISSNVAISFANFPASDVGFITLHITQDATGGRAVTFVPTIKISGGGTLAPVTTANAINIYRVECLGTGSFPYYVFLNAGMA